VSNLVDRLRGKYPVGPTVGDCEPEFGYRYFEGLPPINAEAADEIERLAAEVSKYKEAYAVCARALVLCDSTDRDAPVLNGELWSRARQVIDEIERDSGRE
jgi:hypothetical protein